VPTLKAKEVHVGVSYIIIKFVTFWIYCLSSIESEVPTLCGIDNSILPADS